MKPSIMHAAALLLLVCFVSDVQAQAGRWWEPNSPYNALYDTATVETLTGEIAGIERYLPGRRASRGIHLFVETADGPIDVHLGPTWYVDEKLAGLSVGKRITITGSRVLFNKKPVVLASKVRLDGREFRLRTEQGYPDWARARRAL